jgi:hypothetical protein
MVGAPFFALATLSPTIQAWFARSAHPRARDPFFLYAASNVGSFLGLLAYPLLIEPEFDLIEQAAWFRWGYVVLIGVAVAAALRTPRREEHHVALEVVNTPVTGRTRFFLVVAAAVPSLTLLAVSRHIATDVASFPLLWVVPLALYLGTFVVAFSKVSGRALAISRFVFPFVAIPAVVGTAGVLVSIWLGLGLPLALLVASGLIAHGRLYERRPHARHLTEFYLWVSVGGAVGGLLGAFFAPAVFESVAEYPIAIIATAALLGGKAGRMRAPVKVAMAIVYVAALALALGTPDLTSLSLMVGAAGIATYALAGRSGWMALGLAGALVPGILFSDGHLLVQERTFFGVYRVLETPDGNHLMVSGTTVHGAQDFLPEPTLTPLAYYVPDGPFGQVMREIGTDTDEIGVIGLGAGALASYLEDGQKITYYEIDPAVVNLATDRSLFTFTTDTAGEVAYVVGDGRLTLEQPHPPFGLIVIDAFSSDAIPTHLLTVEAVRAYLEAITPDGVIGFHISNRHLDLEPVVGRLAEELGLVAVVRDFTPTTDTASAVTFMAAARRAEDLGSLLDDDAWREPQVGSELWTDAFSNLLEVIRWR